MKVKLPKTSWKWQWCWNGLPLWVYNWKYGYM